MNKKQSAYVLSAQVLRHLVLARLYIRQRRRAIIIYILFKNTSYVQIQIFTSPCHPRAMRTMSFLSFFFFTKSLKFNDQLYDYVGFLIK